MKTINIQGKEYVTVNERVKEFHKLYPQGCIKTEVINQTENSVTMMAFVYPEGLSGRFFTGIAHEVQDNGYINKTSHFENCETSAVGRALGFLGIGIDTSIASADEVDRVVEKTPEYQSQKKKTLRSIEDWTIEQIKGYELEFGKHKGLRLEQLIGDPRAYEWCRWIIEQKPKDERGEKVQKIITRFIEEVVSPIENEETLG